MQSNLYVRANFEHCRSHSNERKVIITLFYHSPCNLSPLKQLMKRFNTYLMKSGTEFLAYKKEMFNSQEWYLAKKKE